MSKITGAQIRAARALAGITPQQLADAAGLGLATVRRAELEEGPISSSAANASAIRAAFNAAGVAFLEDGKGVILVGLKAPPSEPPS